MLLKKTAWFWKSGFAAISFVLTITPIVDGVWPDYNSDLAFRNERMI